MGDMIIVDGSDQFGDPGVVPRDENGVYLVVHGSSIMSNRCQQREPISVASQNLDLLGWRTLQEAVVRKPRVKMPEVDRRLLSRHKLRIGSRASDTQDFLLSTPG
jgi:hypothetical protein